MSLLTSKSRLDSENPYRFTEDTSYPYDPYNHPSHFVSTIGRMPTAADTPLKKDPSPSSKPLPGLPGLEPPPQDDPDESTTAMSVIHAFMGVLYLAMVGLCVFAAFTITNDSVLAVTDYSWFLIHLVFAVCFGGLLFGYLFYFFKNQDVFTHAVIRVRAWRAIQTLLFATSMFSLFTLINAYLWQISNAAQNHDNLKETIHVLYFFFVILFGIKFMDVFLFDLAAIKIT